MTSVDASGMQDAQQSGSRFSVRVRERHFSTVAPSGRSASGVSPIPLFVPSVVSRRLTPSGFNPASAVSSSAAARVLSSAGSSSSSPLPQHSADYPSSFSSGFVPICHPLLQNGGASSPRPFPFSDTPTNDGAASASPLLLAPRSASPATGAATSAAGIGSEIQLRIKCPYVSTGCEWSARCLPRRAHDHVNNHVNTCLGRPAPY